MSMLNKKTVNASIITEYLYKIFPQDLNASNTMFGGKMMSILDRVASMVAEKHSCHTCVTAAVDALRFIKSVKQGDILVFQASMNKSWVTSMEIGIKVSTENYTLQSRCHILSAYFTFVAVDKHGKPTKVPQVIPETPEQIRRYREADSRRSTRKEKNTVSQ